MGNSLLFQSLHKGKGQPTPTTTGVLAFKHVELDHIFCATPRKKKKVSKKWEKGKTIDAKPRRKILWEKVMEAVNMRLVILIPFLVIVPAVTANIGDFDEVWQTRAEEARKAALQAYNPHPEKVTDNFNKKVHK